MNSSSALATWAECKALQQDGQHMRGKRWRAGRSMAEVSLGW